MSKKSIIINYIILGLLFVLNIFANIYNLTSVNTKNIYENNILKVVEIRTTDDNINWSYATGFFVDTKGTILTNKHVILNSKTNITYNTIQVRLANEDEWINAEILKIAETDDLSKIKINKDTPNYFKLEKNLSNGETIFTIGNPNGFGLSFITGVVSSSERNVIHDEQSIKIFQTSFVLNEGNSGGPVFNKFGNLVGIISFRLKDRKNEVIHGASFALPYSTIKSFL